MYMTEEEIFQDILLYKLSESQKEEFKAIESDDVILCHHGFGMWIRNNYKLWSQDNPYVVLNDSFHVNFPDQISQRIIERLWCQLTGKPAPAHPEIKRVGPKEWECNGVKIYGTEVPAEEQK